MSNAGTAKALLVSKVFDKGLHKSYRSTGEWHPRQHGKHAAGNQWPSWSTRALEIQGNQAVVFGCVRESNDRETAWGDRSFHALLRWSKLLLTDISWLAKTPKSSQNKWGEKVSVSVCNIISILQKGFDFVDIFDIYIWFFIWFFQIFWAFERVSLNFFLIIF